MEDTIAAISTSTVSSGGISIVRISGPDAIIIGDKVFKSKKNIKLANVQSILLRLTVMAVFLLLRRC